mgnify:CR=1 FL=1
MRDSSIAMQKASLKNTFGDYSEQGSSTGRRKAEAQRTLKKATAVAPNGVAVVAV